MEGVTLGLVCARSGSVGLPGKNLRKLGSERLIERAIRIAFEAGCDDVAVSTDYWPSAEFAIGKAAWVLRPAALAGPLVSKWDVYRHAVKAWEFAGTKASHIVDIDVSRPLRTAGTALRVIAALDHTPAAIALAKGGKHPAFDIVMADGDGCHPYDDRRAYVARQQLPPVYVHAGAYGFTRAALFGRGSIYAGPVAIVEVDRAESFDIDDELDWKIVIELDKAARARKALEADYAWPR